MGLEIVGENKLNLSMFLTFAIGSGQILLILLVLTIPIVSTNWFLYKKANKSGWAAIAPIYSTLVWLEIIGKPWYWLLLFCVPYVNLIFIVWATNLTSKSYGKKEGFTFGLIFLPFLFYPILAFGSSKYLGPAGKK